MKKMIRIIIAVLMISFIYFGYREIAKNKDETTEENCFEFNDGVILNYNAICGSKVVIPKTIASQEVTKIGNYAFKNKNIEELVIPETIKIIGVGAFQNNQLRYLTIPDSVLEIKALAFENNQLRDLTIGKNVKDIGIKAFSMNDLKTKYAFIYKRSEDEIDESVVIGYGGRSKEVTIPDGVTTLDRYALAGNEIESIILNDELTRIESYALSDNKFKEIVINPSVSYIGDGNLTDSDIIEINILGKSSIADFNYFDADFSKTSILKYGE